MKKPRRAGEQTAVGDLTRDLFEGAAAVRSVGEALAQSAGQTLARWQILYLLAEGEQTVPTVARRLGLARQNVQRVVDELFDAKIVVAKQNPEHRRSQLYRLTPKGSGMLERINRAAGRWHQKVLRKFSSEDIRRGREFLKALAVLARVDIQTLDGPAGD